MVLIAGVGGAVSYLNSVKVPAKPHTQKLTSFVCAAAVADGECGPENSVAQFSDSEDRIRITLAEVSPNMINAVVAGEDRNFFDHAGIDPWGILRAVVSQARGSASLQGGSTITQQYVKMAYLTQTRALSRKVNEAGIALKLERRLTKSQILELYLNAIYFGRGAYGVEAAAHAYFGSTAHDLNIAEAAYLTGLIRNPLLGDAAKDPKEATRRRKTVLDGMVEMGYITPKEAKAADATPWDDKHFKPKKPPSNGTAVNSAFAGAGGRYVIEMVRQQLTQMPQVGSDRLLKEGLKVYLTVHEDLQTAAMNSVTATLSRPDKDPAAALVSVDKNGQILALIGGRDFETQQVNYALGRDGGGSGRPAGSTFKAIALAAYVEKGNSIKALINAPAKAEFPRADQGKPWIVENHNAQNLGQITVEEATWQSSNTAYAQIMLNQITPKAFSTMGARLGISTPIPSVASAVLGTVAVSPFEVNTMFSTFANDGVRKAPHIVRRVEDEAGRVLYDAATDPALQPVKAIEPAVAKTVSFALTGVVKNGTARGARLGQPVAGKTGTTQNNQDAWFAGYTCDVTTTVWMGYPGKAATGAEPAQPPPPLVNLHGVKEVTGGSLPVDIWRGYMVKALSGTQGCVFKRTDAGTAKPPPDPAFGPTTTTTPPTTTSTTPVSSTTTTVASTTTTLKKVATTTTVVPAA